MAEKVKLELNFKDSNGKNFKLTVDNPIEELTKENIEPVCNTIIEKDVFENKGASLLSIGKVEKVMTTTEEIEM